MNAPIPVRFTAAEWADAEREALAAGASSTEAYLREMALTEPETRRGAAHVTKRNTPKFIPATPEQREQIAALADRAGLSVGSYIRARGLRHPVTLTTRRPPIERAELARLSGLAGNMASNWNQIARVVNTTGNEPMVAQLNGIRENLVILRRELMHALGRGPTG